MIDIEKIYCIDCLNFKQQGKLATCAKGLIIDEHESGHIRYFKLKKDNNEAWLYKNGKSMEALQKDNCLEYIDMQEKEKII